MNMITACQTGRGTGEDADKWNILWVCTGAKDKLGWFLNNAMLEERVIAGFPSDWSRRISALEDWNYGMGKCLTTVDKFTCRSQCAPIVSDNSSPF